MCRSLCLDRVRPRSQSSRQELDLVWATILSSADEGKITKRSRERGCAKLRSVTKTYRESWPWHAELGTVDGSVFWSEARLNRGTSTTPTATKDLRPGTQLTAVLVRYFVDISFWAVLRKAGTLLRVVLPEPNCNSLASVKTCRLCGL